MSVIDSDILKVQEQRETAVVITANSWPALNGLGTERVPCSSFPLLNWMSIFVIDKSGQAVEDIAARLGSRGAPLARWPDTYLFMAL